MEQKNDELIDACGWMANLEKVKSLLKSGANVNYEVSKKEEIIKTKTKKKTVVIKKTNQILNKFHRMKLE